VGHDPAVLSAAGPRDGADVDVAASATAPSQYASTDRGDPPGLTTAGASETRFPRDLGVLRCSLVERVARIDSS